LNLDQVNLLGVYDVNPINAATVAKELGVLAFSRLDELLTSVDAVSIAASTSAHFEIAERCLEAGVHVLLEKPITLDLQEAKILMDLSKQHQCILQIGHLERFNPAYQAFSTYLEQPTWIEMQRLAPYKTRGSEVNVVLDLMIHDLDLLLSWVKSPIVDVKAKGLALMTQDIDIATVAITFANGCVANIHATRVHTGVERLTRVYQASHYYVLNFQEQSLCRYPVDAERLQDLSLAKETIATTRVDALDQQIQAFVASVQKGHPVLVDGLAGHDALELALRIQNAIKLPQIEKEFV
jgi:predicted dehydrogenase